MKVVTFATKEGGAFKFLKQSFHRLSDSTQHDFIVVGWGDAWAGFGDRLKKYRNKIAELNADDLCLVIDGYDVLLTGDLSQFEQQYRSAGHNKVVFSTEAHDNFFDRMGNRCIMGEPVKTERGEVCICAGAFVGTAGAIVTMMDQVIEPGYCDHRYADDQYLLTKLCRENPSAYEYDQDSKWFLTWYDYGGGEDMKKDIVLNANGTLTYKNETSIFVLHRQFAADLAETIVALGYKMTDEDIEAVKRDPDYHIKFFKHHAHHLWHMTATPLKIIAMLLILLSILIIIYLVYLLYVRADSNTRQARQRTVKKLSAL